MVPGHGLKVTIDGAFFGNSFPYDFMEKNYPDEEFDEDGKVIISHEKDPSFIIS